jgi:hypothetical protein
MTTNIRTNDIPNTKENSIMETATYTSKPYPVEAVRVTDENLQSISIWAGGRIDTLNGKSYIHVNVENPLRPRQTQAFVGDWVLKTRNGFKVYLDKAFHNSFDPQVDPLADFVEVARPTAPVQQHIPDAAQDSQRVGSTIVDNLDTTPVTPS